MNDAATRVTPLFTVQTPTMTAMSARSRRRAGQARTAVQMAVLVLSVLAVAVLGGLGSTRVAGQPTRPIYNDREVADARLSLIDAEVTLAYWESEVKRCGTEVEAYAAVSTERDSARDAARAALYAAFPGMLNKAQNARQDAALSVERARKRIEFMDRTNDSVRAALTSPGDSKR